MDKYVELVYAQNWVDQAFDMHWRKREISDTVAYMDSWEDGFINEECWYYRNKSVSDGEMILCR